MHTVKFLRTLVPEPEVCPKSQVSSEITCLLSNDLSVFWPFPEALCVTAWLTFHLRPTSRGQSARLRNRLPPGLRTVAQMLSVESSKLKLSSLIITLANYIYKGKENATGTALSIGH
ncbi:Protein transport protein Sec24D [Manis javanica]|nr:Protein transport protein Sec24D [Manis javanica]